MSATKKKMTPVEGCFVLGCKRKARHGLFCPKHTPKTPPARRSAGRTP